MNAARFTPLLVLLTLLPPFSPAARAGETTDQRYEQLVVVTKKGQRLEGREGRLGATELTASLSSGELASIPLADIKTLYVADGNMAMVTGTLGAILGLTTGFLVALPVLTPNASNAPEAPAVGAGLIGGFTVAGAMIGGLIGSSMLTWRVEPVVAPAKQYAGLQLSLSM